jgi:hypothetical protein
MASYDPYDAPPRERTTKRYYREERRDERDPRYYESRETLHVQPSRDLIPRPREDSDLSVEEIRRDFPPPGYSSRDLRRARSAEPGHFVDDYDDRRSHYSRDRDYDDYDRRSRKKTDYHEEERKKKARMLSKQEQIIAAVTGAALAIGGKELYDRREANQHGTEVQRNLLASAALGAAGAFAGYQGTELYNKHKEKEERKKYGYYSDDEETAKEKKGHKNFLESALAAAGLGGAVKALTGGKDDKSDTRSRRGSRSRSRSRSTSRSRDRDRDRDGKHEGAGKVQKAAMASLIAGATEAFRISKQPGSWKGEKAKRILTAAAGAATLDAAQNPEKAGSKLGLAEAVVGGLLGNRVINGSKKNIEMDEKTGRSRSRSRARSKDGGGGGVSGLAALATAGLGAFGAKKIMDHRERSRSRRRSVDSRDSRDGSPDRRHRSRSRSVVDSARRRLAKVGIGNGPDDDDRDRRDRSRDRSRDRRRDYDDYEDSGRSRRHRDDYDDYDRDRSRDRRRRDDYDDDRSHRGGGRDRSRQRRGSVSSDDLGDSDDDRKRGKKLRGKQIITTGLAAVATIHAAHSVYQSMEKRHLRQKALQEGKISPEQAKKLKDRALLQDAAAVGIAALGIKGAISEVKEANELRHEMHQWKLEKEERHRRRLEKQKLLANGGGGSVDGTDQLGGRRADNWSSAAPPGADRYNDGPRYADGNPYGAILPAGPPDRR